MFGFGGSLLVEDQEILRQQRASITAYDPRQAAAVARVFKDKSDEVRQNESAQQSAEREVVELLGELKSAESAIKKMEKAGLAVSEKVTRKLEMLKSRLAAARSAEATQTRIAKARRENLNNWLEEGSPTNRELIELDRAQSEALRA